MFNTILTNNPSNWPWPAYISLPLLPISLITSRFQESSLLIPLLLWPLANGGPVGEQARRLFEYWSKPENIDRLSQMNFIPAHSWPPPPLIFGIIIFPMMRVFYHKFYAHLYLKSMGTPLPPPRRVSRMNFGFFAIQVRIVNGQEQNLNDEGQQQRLDQQQEQGQAAADDEDPDPAEVAEQLTAASLERRIGGALIIPSVSSFMGNLLFRLSNHSGILRSFLGIRPKIISRTNYMLPPWGSLYSRLGVLSVDKGWKDLDPYQRVKIGFQLMINTFTSGSWTLVDSDPVWCVLFFFFWLVSD